MKREIFVERKLNWFDRLVADVILVVFIGLMFAHEILTGRGFKVPPRRPPDRRRGTAGDKELRQRQFMARSMKHGNRS